MEKSIDYGILMHDAMRELVKRVLRDVAKDGLPGDHHFYITFDTRHPDVALANWLRDRYPEEMTIVVQHWFADLEVSDEGFGVTLNFGDNPENMYLPLDSIKSFVDPSVDFGLQFEMVSTEDDDPDDGYDPEPEQDEGHKSGEVVSLDQFRKS